MSVRFDDHVLERYREHHPNALQTDVVASFGASTEIDRGVVGAITQAPRRANGTDLYRLSPDGRGLFVQKAIGVVIGYLRLSPVQQGLLKKRALPDLSSDLEEELRREIWWRLREQYQIEHGTEVSLSGEKPYLIEQRILSGEWDQVSVSVKNRQAIVSLKSAEAASAS